MAAAPEMVLHLWCSPRSLSTCTMYSFAQRPDCVVLDEPLYAHWLLRNPEAYRPYRQQLLEQHNTDGEQVLKQMHSPRTDGKKIVVAKHIVKQFAGLDFSVLENPNNRHLLIIRDPLDVLLAWNAVNEVHKEDSSHDNMGLPQLVQLYLYVKKSTGQEPIIVDSEILKKYPKGVLRAVCSRLGIQFYEEQLRWTSGPKPYDGYGSLRPFLHCLQLLLRQHLTILSAEHLLSIC